MEVFRRKLRHQTVHYFRCLSSDTSEKSTHFGFETVSESEKEKKVHNVFANVAEKYDLMNDAMSGGIHRLWKDQFISRMKPIHNCHYLDVAGGTGDIAFRIAKYLQNQPNQAEEFSEEHEQNTTRIVVCDINENMLNVGKSRAGNVGFKNIEWIRGSAEKLPFGNESFHVFSIAYGIRNITRIEKALQEAYRILKPGGRFMCLEFSTVDNLILSSLYDWYSFNIIPVTGKLLANDWHSYQYLVESIRQFPKPDDFASLIKNAGFKFVNYEKLFNGISAIHSGFKL